MPRSAIIKSATALSSIAGRPPHCSRICKRRRGIKRPAPFVVTKFGFRQRRPRSVSSIRRLGRLPVSRPKPDHNKKQNTGAQPDNVRPSQLASVPRCPGNKNHNRQNDDHDCKKNAFQRHGMGMAWRLWVSDYLSVEARSMCTINYVGELIEINRLKKVDARVSGGDTRRSQGSLWPRSSVHHGMS